LLGCYIRTLLWYFLAMAVAWLVGFESIYGHPTPFYALFSPALDTVWTYGFISIAVFFCFFALWKVTLRRTEWFEEPWPIPPLRFLAGVILFSILFSCAVAMLRNGFTGISQAYQRETYEYVGDIGKGSTIRALFKRYLDLMPYLSLHARAAPPGPIALLWLLSYLVGRGALALSLATVVVGALAIIPLYYWSRDLTNERTARTCCMVYALIPSIVLFTATSAEILFMPFTISTLFLFDRALKRNSLKYAAAAGIGFALMSLLKFTLLGIGVYFCLIGLWGLFQRETRRAVFRVASAMLIMFIAVHFAVRWWSGFDVLSCIKVAQTHFDMDQAKLDTITPRLSGWVYRFLNPLSWFYFAGIPVSLLFLWRLWKPEPATKIRFLLFAATLLVLNILYLGRGEGERSALYIFPFLALPAAHLLDEMGNYAKTLGPMKITLIFMAFQCWLTEALFYTYW